MLFKYAIAALVIGLAFGGTSCKAYAQDFVLAAPPVHDRQTSHEIYQPLADLLSRASGKEVVYIYPGNWLNYLRDMQKSRYDFIVDAAHFVSWRIEKIEHTPVVSLADSMTYLVITRENSGFEDLWDLRGKVVCGSSVPNLDSLTVLDQFDAEGSRPVLHATSGYPEASRELLSRRCDAAVLPERVYQKQQGAGELSGTKVIFRSFALPHYALSASPRVGENIRVRIEQALLSKDADDVLAGLLGTFGLPATAARLTADSDVYTGYAYLLDDFWGF